LPGCGGVLDRKGIDVESEILRDPADPVGGTDEDGWTTPARAALITAPSEGVIAWMRDGCRDRRMSLQRARTRSYLPVPCDSLMRFLRAIRSPKSAP